MKTPTTQAHIIEIMSKPYIKNGKWSVSVKAIVNYKIEWALISFHSEEVMLNLKAGDVVEIPYRRD